ncbi:hypothetical protein KGM_214482A, partial [Danaus plexippus plexippus]
MRAADTVHI